MLFYFTGTGNSLYIAKQIEDVPISIPQVMRQDQREFYAESMGIVAPIYGHEVPSMVKDFMKNTIFHTDYFYMILTYGNRHGGAAELAKKLCDECGIKVDYIHVILMVDNWLTGFDMGEQKKLDKKVDEQLATILHDLKIKKKEISAVSDSDRAAHQQFVENQKKVPQEVWNHFIQIKDNCIGCGICEKVCPSSSIHIVDGKAVYHFNHCQTCLACAHACPQKAIGLAIPEKNSNERYRNEHISLQEIIQSNSQVSNKEEK